MTRTTQARGRLGQADVWAVVPVKDQKAGKRRLSPVLDAKERRLLCRAMLQDVLTALSAAVGLAGILVVTRDASARAAANQFAASVVAEPENLGQTEAVTLAAEKLAADGVTSMLTVPADVPLVTPEEIIAVLSTHGPAPAVTIAPASDRLGSNAVMCSPPDVFPFRFGENSYYAHLKCARECGIEPHVVRQPGLARDIDVPEDLKVFAAKRSSTRAYHYLERSGIIARLHDVSRRLD